MVTVVTVFTLAAALLAEAPRAQSAEGAGREFAAECGSVVVVKCEKPKSIDSPRAAAERAQRIDRSGRVESRRSGSVQELDAIVIEADRIRQLSAEEAIERALRTETPRAGTHTYSTGVGTQCTCMNICPPWWTLMPCCSCTSQTGSRMSTAPGSSPLR